MVEELLTMLPEEGNPPLWNIKNKEGNTILHELACSDSMMNLAGKVLGRYEPYEDKRKELEMLLTARNEFGETPIFCAARHGQTEMFKFLAKEMKLKVGSVKDVMSLPEDMKLKELQELSKSQHHLQRDDKTTVLHISITTECFELAYYIARTYSYLIEENDRESMTALQYLACNPTAFGKNMKMRQGVMEELMISLDPFKELGNNLKKIFNSKYNTFNFFLIIICSSFTQLLFPFHL
uniref:Ankyrin repeat-containing protein n=1 Tax=Vitis vinifera TaxID=29760 RepID=F6I2G8_VITVI